MRLWRKVFRRVPNKNRRGLRPRPFASLLSPSRKKPPFLGGFRLVGTVRLELMTSCMSSMRSNQLSYAPARLNTIPFSGGFVNKKRAFSEFFKLFLPRRRGGAAFVRFPASAGFASAGLAASAAFCFGRPDAFFRRTKASAVCAKASAAVPKGSAFSFNRQKRTAGGRERAKSSFDCRR